MKQRHQRPLRLLCHTPQFLKATPRPPQGHQWLRLTPTSLVAHHTEAESLFADLGETTLPSNPPTRASSSCCVFDAEVARRAGEEERKPLTMPVGSMIHRNVPVVTSPCFLSFVGIHGAAGDAWSCGNSPVLQPGVFLGWRSTVMPLRPPKAPLRLTFDDDSAARRRSLAGERRREGKHFAWKLKRASAANVIQLRALKSAVKAVPAPPAMGAVDHHTL